MLSFKELREKRMAVSADFKISASGRKVHKMKKIADTEDDLEDKEDDKEVKESTLDEEFSSGNAQHSLSGKSEKQQHSDYMKKTHNVTTKYHGSDEVSYHGSKANVKKALVNHYDDEGEAKEMHPHAFKESVDESVVPAHMQGKQKPYVSSDGKGNYEVLGNKGQTKAEFSRKEHGKDAHKKAQSHLKTKYNEYMKEGRSDVVIQTTAQNMDDNDKHVTALRDAGIHASQGAGASHHIIVPPEHADKARRILAGHLKEETQLEEAVDKQEQRFIQLARLGLVDKSNVSKLRIAIDQLKADKLLTVQQRSLLLSVMMDLVDLVTGDDAVFQRVKMDVQKEDTQLDEGENKQMKGEDPCWKNYKMVGMKDKGGKKVPNCVPEETDPPFDGPYTKVPSTSTDKSGAQHTPMSRARHLAKLALAKQANKSKAK